jgi:hypothetical protein
MDVVELEVDDPLDAIAEIAARGRFGRARNKQPGGQAEDVVDDPVHERFSPSVLV